MHSPLPCAEDSHPSTLQILGIKRFFLDLLIVRKKHWAGRSLNPMPIIILPHY